jgi:hypothetical protein
MKTASLLISCAIAVQPLLALTQQPVGEFEAGAIEKFSTRGHPKANGVVMTLPYPKSWSAAEGERPDVVQKFVSDSGKGLEQVLIITTALPADITPQKIEELLSEGGIKDCLPKGATFIGASQTKIANQPAGLLEYSMPQEGAKAKLDTHTVACIFVQARTMVQVQFQIIGSTFTDSKMRLPLFRPLWDDMMHSIVLADR